MSSFKALLIANIIAFSICSARRVDKVDRIVGGYETSIEQHPWQVSLIDGASHSCGGSIIGNQWILTAAHCTRFSTADRLSVRVGSSYHRDGGSVVQVKRIIEHEHYKYPRHDYDVALLELDQPVNFNDSIQTVALPNENTYISDGTPCVVTGWGLTRNVNESNEILRGVNITIINQRQCRRQYGRTITRRMICAGIKEGGKDSCNGDSGGPLHCNIGSDNNPVLVGVVSFGADCAKPKYPGVYARVTEFRTWIKNNTGI